jgi:hypothetical protein
MSLDSLHDIGEEPFTLLNETIFPHLIRYEADEIGWEQNLFDGRGVGEARCWNLQSADKTIEDVLI